MALTLDYPAWFAAVDSDDHEDIYALYKAVEHAIDTGYYRCTENEGAWTVSSPATEEQLLLSSQEVRQALLTLIETRYFAGMDSDNWIALMRAMTDESGC
jgi:hypothetical protein